MRLGTGRRPILRKTNASDVPPIPRRSILLIGNRNGSDTRQSTSFQVNPMRSSIVSACVVASLFANAAVSSAQTRSGNSSTGSSGKCSAQTLQKVSSGVSTAVRTLQGSKVSSTAMQAVQNDATALMPFAHEQRDARPEAAASRTGAPEARHRPSDPGKRREPVGPGEGGSCGHRGAGAAARAEPRSRRSDGTRRSAAVGAFRDRQPHRDGRPLPSSLETCRFPLSAVTML